jgi:sulfur-oxidizing protein SoxA
MMRAVACSAVLALAMTPALAQQKSQFEDYQRMTAEGSPVELFELLGEEAWKKKQGPKNASLEQCDLGKGPGVLKGVYAALPRYFKDVDRVMDLETRLLHCMTTLQGRTREEATKRVFGNADNPSEMEVL